jgi:hypothetical protein
MHAGHGEGKDNSQFGNLRKKIENKQICSLKSKQVNLICLLIKNNCCKKCGSEKSTSERRSVSNPSKHQTQRLKVFTRCLCECFAEMRDNVSSDA